MHELRIHDIALVYTSAGHYVLGYGSLRLPCPPTSEALERENRGHRLDGSLAALPPHERLQRKCAP